MNRINTKNVLLFAFVSRGLFLILYLLLINDDSLIPITKDTFFDAGTDGYVQIAYNLFHKNSYEYLTGWKVHNRAPLHPFILTITMISPKYWFVLWLFISLVLFIIATFYWIKLVKFLQAKQILNSYGVNLLMLLWLFHPYMFLFIRTTTFLPEAITLIVMWMYFLVKFYFEHNSRNLIRLSIISGLLILTHSSFMLIPILVVAFLLILKRFKHIVIYSLLTLLIISPWIYRNYKVFGKVFLYSGAGSQYWKGEESAFGTDDAEIKTLAKAKGHRTAFLYFSPPTPKDDKILLKLAIEDVIKNPVKTVKRFFIGLYMFWAPYEKGLLKSLILAVLNFPVVIFTYYLGMKKFRENPVIINFFLLTLTTFWFSFAFFCANASFFVMFLPLLFLCFAYFVQQNNDLQSFNIIIQKFNSALRITGK